MNRSMISMAVAEMRKRIVKGLTKFRKKRKTRNKEKGWKIKEKGWREIE